MLLFLIIEVLLLQSFFAIDLLCLDQDLIKSTSSMLLNFFKSLLILIQCFSTLMHALIWG